jgi:hypothetical protein
MALLSERDSRAWQALAGAISRRLEPRLAPGVLANRTLAEAGGRRMLGPALRRARSAARKLGGRADLVIRTDVRAFYPSVTPSVAFRTLVGLDVDRGLAAQAATMLEAWGSEGYAGLPIGPPGSAVLANAVLAGVDAGLAPLPFLRWVDDYLVGAERERDIAGVLDRLDSALEEVGLERSMPKTEILEGGLGPIWPGTYGRTGPSE